MKLLTSDVSTLNLIGAITSVAIMILMIIVFLFRLAKQPMAGRAWTISAIVLFLSMAGLAFYQRAKTGM